ncbi:MAG: transposase [bacterium]
MSRRGRINLPNHFYHVICRGQRKDKIFLCDDDKIFFLKVLAKILKRCDVEVYAFCLMDNHYHLLLKEHDDKLEKLLKSLNTRYAMYFNRKYGFVGHVFQDRPKILIVLSEKYVLSIIKYIHNNPVSKMMVEKQTDYTFSSASGYNNPQKNNYQFVSIFTNSNKIKQVALKEDLIKFKEDYIGDRRDFKKIEKRNDARFNKDYNNKRTGEFIKPITLKKLCQIMKLEEEEFKDVEIRRKAAFELFKMGYNEREIAKLLKISKSTVSRYLNDKNA